MIKLRVVREDDGTPVVSGVLCADLELPAEPDEISDTRNAIGVALYEKFGFQIEGTHYMYAFLDGEYVDAYSMARITKRES